MSSERKGVVQPGANSGRYVIVGDPGPWARAGYNKKQMYVYDTQKAVKHVMVSNMLEQHNGRPLFEGPLELSIIFYMRMPKATKARYQQMLGAYHWTRPDLDNLEKLIKDVGTGVLYRDDCQVAQVYKKKIYDEDPRTEFTITELR